MFLFRKDKQKPFHELMNPHIGFLYNVALKYSGNPYDAEDMVQETLFIALKKIGQLKDEAKIKGWLFRILRNVFLNEIRISGQQRHLESDKKDNYLTILSEASETMDIHALMEKKLDHLFLQQVLDRLPEKYKSPLILHFMEDLSYREIAEYLDLPVGTVMSRLSRAKTVLKKELLKSSRKGETIGNVIALQEFKNNR